ncbi:MAG: FISUMP domain-containing protein [Bacteroidota bacterium]
MKSQLNISAFIHGICMILALIFIPAWLTAQESGTFTDARDGRVYHWTKEGSQTLMTENLQFIDTAGSWAYNNDDSVHVLKYGRLYNWKSAVKSCPKGWRLPSEKEWNKLIMFLGEEVAGLKMQAMDTIGKTNPKGQPIDPQAYSSLLSGIRHPNGTCLNVTYWGGCWSATAVNDTTATNVLFVRKGGTIGISANDKRAGFAVRCVKK